jgi:ferrochelatase
VPGATNKSARERDDVVAFALAGRRSLRPVSSVSDTSQCQAPVQECQGIVTEVAHAAVVLMAYGSPERLADVPAYYADIRGGRPIKPELLKDLVERYRRLGIEDGSPLNAITEETRAALQRELDDVPVFTGMKHWTPRIADAAEHAIAGGAQTVAGLVLAPHYSAMSIAGYQKQLEEAIGDRAEIVFIESWHDDPRFVDVLAERVRGTEAHVVFTAHSLPARILEAGDPYKDQLLETSQLVAERAALRTWTFSFQSESDTGEPWLGPDILDHLEELHERGVEDVLVCPVGFVADHLEIRWDLDHEAQEKAVQLGMHLDRIEMPNADPAFVRVLAGLVRRALSVPSGT